MNAIVQSYTYIDIYIYIHRYIDVTLPENRFVTSRSRHRRWMMFPNETRSNRTILLPFFDLFLVPHHALHCCCLYVHTRPGATHAFMHVVWLIIFRSMRRGFRRRVATASRTSALGGSRAEPPAVIGLSAGYPASGATTSGRTR